MNEWSCHVSYASSSSFLSTATINCEMRRERLSFCVKENNKNSHLILCNIVWDERFCRKTKLISIGYHIPLVLSSKSENEVQLIKKKEFKFCTDFSFITWYQCIKLDGVKKSPVWRLGISAWTHLSTLVCHFILQQHSFLERKFARGLVFLTVIK